MAHTGLEDLQMQNDIIVFKTNVILHRRRDLVDGPLRAGGDVNINYV